MKKIYKTILISCILIFASVNFVGGTTIYNSFEKSGKIHEQHERTRLYTEGLDHWNYCHSLNSTENINNCLNYYLYPSLPYSFNQTIWINHYIGTNWKYYTGWVAFPQIIIIAYLIIIEIICCLTILALIGFFEVKQ